MPGNPYMVLAEYRDSPFRREPESAGFDSAGIGKAWRGGFSGMSCGRRSKGFTLVEVLISVVLIGLLAAVGSSMIADGFATTYMVNSDNASTSQARYALERLAREIREIKHISTASYCIDTMSQTQLAFKKPLNGSTDETDCVTAVSSVNINFSSPSLTLNSSLLADVSNSGSFQMKYFKSDGKTETTSSTDIVFVQITLVVHDNTSGQDVSQRTRIALRNS